MEPHNGVCGLTWWLLVTRTNVGELVAVMSKKQAVGERHNINLRIAQLWAAQGPSQSYRVLMQSGGSHLASVLVNQRHTTSLAGLEAYSGPSMGVAMEWKSFLLPRMLSAIRKDPFTKTEASSTESL